MTNTTRYTLDVVQTAGPNVGAACQVVIDVADNGVWKARGHEALPKPIFNELMIDFWSARRAGRLTEGAELITEIPP